MKTANLSAAPDKNVFYTKHSKGATVFLEGKSYSISEDAPLYPSFLEALRNKDWAKVKTMVNVKSALTDAALKVGKRIRFINGQLVYTSPKDGAQQPLKGPLVDRVVQSLRDGLSADTMLPLLRYMDNVMANKRKDIREELYQFLQAGAMPITLDGCFLAYKRVKGNYKDYHSGAIDNSPGKLVSMPAEKVDGNRMVECSSGLHFCARSYLANFSGDRTVIVKVNPRHVGAIPMDYNFAKGRCSEYFVIGECTGDVSKDEMFIKPFVFDEKVQLQTVAPQVKFIADTKISINARAEAYGLLVPATGKRALMDVWVRVYDSKGELPLAKRSIVKKVGKEFISTITGKTVPAEHCATMAASTKSVRPLLVRAVAKVRNH